MAFVTGNAVRSNLTNDMYCIAVNEINKKDMPNVSDAATYYFDTALSEICDYGNAVSVFVRAPRDTVRIASDYIKESLLGIKSVLYCATSDGLSTDDIRIFDLLNRAIQSGGCEEVIAHASKIQCVPEDVKYFYNGLLHSQRMISDEIVYESIKHYDEIKELLERKVLGESPVSENLKDSLNVFMNLGQRITERSLLRMMQSGTMQSGGSRSNPSMQTLRKPSSIRE